MDTRSLGVDWDGLERLVEQSDMPHRDTVLHILRHTPEWVLTNGVVTDSRKRQLGMLAGGSPWRYMERHFFPSLRCSHLRVYTDGPLQVATDGAAIPCPVQDTIYIERECVRTLVERDTSYVYSLYMAVKTNLLYDALLVPNLALEFYLGNRWSLSGGWMYAWWKNDTRHRYWRIYGGELELRRYFGRKAEEKPLTGHHLGIYLQGLTYDFEWGARDTSVTGPTAPASAMATRCLWRAASTWTSGWAWAIWVALTTRISPRRLVMPGNAGRAVTGLDRRRRKSRSSGSWDGTTII